jgi:ActR/RegA family two-component response regulator
MSCSFFVIDAEADYRSLLAHHLTARWPDAKVTPYDPLASGRLPESFAGAGHDLVLLGHPLGEESGLDWLRQFVGSDGFPPVVMIGTGHVRDIVAAIKQGASDYVIRDQLSHKVLIDIVASTLDTSTGRPLLPEVGTNFEIPGLKNYRVQRRISGGDIASVYLTEEISTGRSVVLKVLQQVPDFGGNTAFDRFLREFDLIANIEHPNVVKIFDLGVADDKAFIAMEYCGRGSLKRRILEGMSADKAIAYMCQIAGALAAIHAVGVAHRDLKPTNVMFREDNSLALIDFGLAKEAALKGEITGSGEIFGTPYYMSPEQGHGNPADARADIYSLGVIFYEMLTGEKPFVGDAAMAVIMQHARAPIPRLPKAVARFQPMIDRMMAKQRDERFQSIEELLGSQPELING